MTRLARIVHEFLELMEWSGDVEEEESEGRCRLETGASIGGQPCRVYLDTHDESDTVAFFVYLPFHANPDWHAEACVLANAINHRVRHGRLEIDPEDGELRFVVSADVEGVEPNGRFARSMAMIARAVLARWMGPIAAVCVSGRKAADVLAEEEARESLEDEEDEDAGARTGWNGGDPAGTIH